jgi:hydrogenase nickel incorporation protein HypA/HybF
MHEFSIANALLQIALRNAQGRRVARVEVTVGHLRQVVPSSLEFAFEVCARGTAAEGAQLVLSEVPVSARCRGCGARTELTGFPWACRACESADVELTGGEELQVEALELEVA